jgi:hypothetical protein
VKMTRLSCHKFRSNEVRLWLRRSIMAYNLGNLWQRLVLPQRIRELVLNQRPTAVGENRRPIGQARSVLLVAPGGKPSDTTAVRSDGGTDWSVLSTGRIGALSVPAG